MNCPCVIISTLSSAVVFFHLRRLKSVRRILGADRGYGLVSAFMTTWLDYCNSVLAGLPQFTIEPLQRVRNAAAGHVAWTGTRDHITPVPQSLHWLPIRFRIIYKLCVLMHLAGASWSQPCVSVWHDDIRRWPAWSWETEILQELPIWTSTVETKVRRAEFLVLRTEGIELSSVQSLQELTITDTFKKLLKTHFVKLAFGELEDFVDVPLVTVGVIGVWNDVM